MEHPAQATQPDMGFTIAAQTGDAAPTYLPSATGFTGAAQMGYTTPTYLPAATVTGVPGTIPPPFPVPPPHPFAYPQVPQFDHSQQQQLLQEFWSNQKNELEQTTNYKNHSLPLARIKKIMKPDEGVEMISSESSVLMVKACEVFILELMQLSWIHTEQNRRMTLQKNDIADAISETQKNDIADAISETEILDFLVNIIPRNEVKEEGVGIPRAVGGPVDQMLNYSRPAHADSDAVAASGVHGPQDQLYIFQQAQTQAQAKATQEAAAPADA